MFCLEMTFVVVLGDLFTSQRTKERPHAWREVLSAGVEARTDEGEVVPY